MFRDVALSVVKLERTIIKHITILVCSSSENLVTSFFFSKSRGDPACSSVSVFRCFGVPVFRCFGVPVFRCSGVPVFGFPVFLILKFAKHDLRSQIWRTGKALSK